jgi:hypothetical protein
MTIYKEGVPLETPSLILLTESPEGDSVSYNPFLNLSKF